MFPNSEETYFVSNQVGPHNYTIKKNLIINIDKLLLMLH